MRLLNTRSLELAGPYVPNKVPDYAIFSHRWSDEEVTFADICNVPIPQLERHAKTRKSISKLQGACKLALEHGYDWIWIDNCCIDKSSSAELQEAINSMWRYYAESNVCYAYFEDVADEEAGRGAEFAKSKWFTRGWTLQELIAPVHVEFYAANWAAIGTKLERYEQIADITSIDPDVLTRAQAIDMFSAAERLSWAAHRNVTREEDEAYALLGLFDINMSLLYGEGRQKAFIRLQQAIYNSSTDHSMFLFHRSGHIDAHPLLADSPTRFCDRSMCTLCWPGVPSDLRSANIIASDIWRTQAHETIMTTVTKSRNEMSTVLPLLAYGDVESTLTHFDKFTSKSDVTHVAVLNHTTAQHPEGALCLLLRSQPDSDEFLRLQLLPAILHELGDLRHRLLRTKLLVCPGPNKQVLGRGYNTVFSVSSDLFQVDKWNINRCPSVSYARTGPDSEFRMQTGSSAGSLQTVQITCRLSISSLLPNLLLSIRLGQMNEVWSIREIYERKKGNRSERKLRTLFASTVPADRCSVHLRDGWLLLVQLRRLPGTARACEEDPARIYRYQISIT